MKELYEKLLQADVGVVLEKEHLSKHTTMKIGGPADLFLIPKNLQSLTKAVALINEYNVPIRAIGRGSNLLVGDGGIEGVVIKISDVLDHFEVEDDVVKVGAGYSLIKLVTALGRMGLTGFEWAGGIPASVGGAVYMNAGAHKSDISKILKEATVLFYDGEIATLTNEDLKFSYRTSLLQKERPGICLEATFVLKKGNRDVILAEMQQHREYRKATQPWNYPCAGSIFRNPLPQFAGRLIEDNNLKGYSIGGAQISPMHANFIVNANNGTAKDVLHLIEHVKKTIKETNGIDLHTEVEIIGRHE